MTTPAAPTTICVYCRHPESSHYTIRIDGHPWMKCRECEKAKRPDGSYPKGPTHIAMMIKVAPDAPTR